jgi:hypothetical protein
MSNPSERPGNSKSVSPPGSPPSKTKTTLTLPSRPRKPDPAKTQANKKRENVLLQAVKNNSILPYEDLIFEWAKPKQGSMAYITGYSDHSPIFFSKVYSKTKAEYESELHLMVEKNIDAVNTALQLEFPNRPQLHVCVPKFLQKIETEWGESILFYEWMDLKESVESIDPVGQQIFKLLQTTCGILQTDIGTRSSKYIRNFFKLTNHSEVYVVTDFGQAVMSGQDVPFLTSQALRDKPEDEINALVKGKQALYVNKKIKETLISYRLAFFYSGLSLNGFNSFFFFFSLFYRAGLRRRKTAFALHHICFFER